jgi:hypothetical protein
MEVIVALLAVLSLVALVITWSASRLDHLHTRLERMDATVDAELLRRSGATLELATSGLLDPATAMVLADAAHRSRRVGPDSREEAESALTEALLVAFDDVAAAEAVVASLDAEAAEVAGDLLADLGAASRRVQTARRLYNATVSVTRNRRRSRFVRLFHLAGRAAMPEPIEFDDRVPGAFSR